MVKLNETKLKPLLMKHLNAKTKCTKTNDEEVIDINSIEGFYYTRRNGDEIDTQISLNCDMYEYVTATYHENVREVSSMDYYEQDYYDYDEIVEDTSYHQIVSISPNIVTLNISTGEISLEKGDGDINNILESDESDLGDYVDDLDYHTEILFDGFSITVDDISEYIIDETDEHIAKETEILFEYLSKHYRLINAQHASNKSKFVFANEYIELELEINKVLKDFDLHAIELESGEYIFAPHLSEEDPTLFIEPLEHIRKEMLKKIESKEQ